MSLYVCNPSARDRQDPTDFKGWKLDFDGKSMVVEAGGLAPGVLSYWNLENKEEIFAVYKNGKQADGSVVNARLKIDNEEEVKNLYDKFKSVIFQACTVNMFRGGAFANKVKIDSPLDDVLEFIYWSPVMTKEHRGYFTTIFSLNAKIISSLKARRALNPEAIDKYQLDLLGIKNFFDSDKKNPAPIPGDISQAWQKEFGGAWTKIYALALRDGPKAPFQIAVPPECYRDRDGLTIKGWNTSMATANTQDPMLKVSAGTSSDYAEVIRAMGTMKGGEQIATAGLSNSAFAGPPPIMGAKYGEEYHDRFEGGIIGPKIPTTPLKDMLDKAKVVKQVEAEKKAIEDAKKRAAAQIAASEEAAKHMENKKGRASTGSSNNFKKGKDKGMK